MNDRTNVTSSSEASRLRSLAQTLPDTACTVLIVDDMATLRMTLAWHIQQLGHETVLAADGKEALGQLKSRRFDLVLLDVVMPEMDGYAVLEQIKQSPRLRDIPVVMISGVDDLQSVVRCIEAGAEDYLTKPFEPTLLRARVRACLEKKHLWDELDNKYQQLQALENLRDSLTHMIVHDLRTPLSSLLMGLQTLEVEGALNSMQQECLSIGVGGGQALLEMINDLLDISKMEAGSLKLDYGEVDVTALVKHAVHQVRALLQDKELIIKDEVQPSLRPLQADQEKLRRVLVNLLGNAIRFTASGGTITISAWASELEGTFSLAVRDTGEGIPPEAFERIFEKFGQVENRKAGRTLSTGLGLTFCRMVMEAHGGRIWVESIQGEGSTFFIQLPI